MLFQVKEGINSYLKNILKLYLAAAGNRQKEMRVLSDFIAGMTDRYAVEFYGRLHSDLPQTIFKDL